MTGQEIRMAGIPSAKKYAAAVRPQKVNMEELGELAITCMAELLGVLRTFVADEAARRRSFGGYLKAYDSAVEREMRYLTALSREFRIELGVVFYTRGLLDELMAYHELLRAPEGDGEDDDSREKKKKAGSEFKKSISNILPRWWPRWLEKVIEEILDLL